MTAGVGPIQDYKCKKCGHDCHCKWDQCDCGCDTCDCGKTINERDIPSSFTNRTQVNVRNNFSLSTRLS